MKTLGDIGLENFAIQYAPNNLRDRLLEVGGGKIALRCVGRAHEGIGESCWSWVFGQPVETVLPVCYVAFGLSTAGFGVCFRQAGRDDEGAPRAHIKGQNRRIKPQCEARQAQIIMGVLADIFRYRMQPARQIIAEKTG